MKRRSSNYVKRQATSIVMRWGAGASRLVDKDCYGLEAGGNYELMFPAHNVVENAFSRRCDG